MTSIQRLAIRFCILVSLLFVFPAQAMDDVQISTRKITVDEHKGTEQDLPRGKSRSVERLIVYRMEFKRMNPGAPSDPTVQWMVLIEDATGVPRIAARGEQVIDLPFARPVTLETDQVRLLGREWRGGPAPGTIEDTILGYGIRLLAPDGVVIAEKYDPPSVESRIDWKKVNKEEMGPVRKEILRRLLEGRDKPARQPARP